MGVTDGGSNDGTDESGCKPELPAPVAELIAFAHGRLDDDERVALGPPGPACWDPARALAEVRKNRLLLLNVEQDLRDDPSEETARWRLYVLALPYATHPDYRAEWAEVDAYGITSDGTD